MKQAAESFENTYPIHGGIVNSRDPGGNPGAVADIDEVAQCKRDGG
jgi:hypothetical protein